ncbi:MAG: tol-pal system-associated acyl-CoA thioesterase [Rhodospirillaceae bacterium]|nr:tol-pal system-associated acyl-CoA thioesterase [Rhodospirillaceae bacterium]|tara:strand:+ start:477 stop:887 length:411 start_codon:yes stop_codon:yes gene_type:complete
MMVSLPHIYPLRVYYEDTDAGGIVYYANYLKFAERARSELLRSIGSGNIEVMVEFGVSFAVSSCAIKYRRPAKLDDMLEVRTGVAKIGGATMTMIQEVYRGSDRLVEMNVQMACLNKVGQPTRLPQLIRDSFSSLA